MPFFSLCLFPSAWNISLPPPWSRCSHPSPGIVVVDFDKTTVAHTTKKHTVLHGLPSLSSRGRAALTAVPPSTQTPAQPSKPLQFRHPPNKPRRHNGPTAILSRGAPSHRSTNSLLLLSTASNARALRRALRVRACRPTNGGRCSLRACVRSQCGNSARFLRARPPDRALAWFRVPRIC